jgi:hypothetical protein
MDWLLALENSGLGDLVRSSAQVYAVLQVGHLLSMAALVGTGLVLDVRLLGLTRMPLAELLRLTDPVLAVAAAVALITGLMMFSGEATTMAANPAFRAKICSGCWLATHSVFSLVRVARCPPGPTP